MVASKASHTVAVVPASGCLAGAGGSGRGMDMHGAALHTAAGRVSRYLVEYTAMLAVIVCLLLLMHARST